MIFKFINKNYYLKFLYLFFIFHSYCLASSLDYSSFLGGSKGSVVNDIFIDKNGYIYIIGETASEDFPVTNDAYDKTYNGGTMDAFIIKVAPNGTKVFSTYFGGSSEDSAASIYVDPEGYIYITGKTYSTNFPTTQDVLDRTLSGGRDGFVAKFSPDGRNLIYSTYLGGNSWDYGKCITVDTNTGCAYIGGFTHGGFPVTPGAAQTNFGGYGDGFVCKLNSNATALLYSSYIGGNSWDGVGGIFLDKQGNLYITGDTHSTNFPTTPGAYDRDASKLKTNYSTDGFVAKLNPDGSQFIYSTLLGGKTSPGSEGFNGIFVDEEGNAYVVGQSNQSSFPITNNALQKTYGGGAYDAVIAKINSTGSALLYSSFFGGNGDDSAFDIVLDNEKNIFICGYTSSSNIPLGQNPLQSSNAGGYDAFFARINNSLGGLLYSTYLGGSSDENIRVVFTKDSQDNIYIAGKTSSQNFPVTSNAIQQSFGGGASDGFLSKVIGIYTPHVNTKPVARAGHDQFIETNEQSVLVTLDGTSSYDPDPDDFIETYSWYDRDGNLIATGSKPTIRLPRGIHYITLVVNDGELNSEAFIEDTADDSQVIICVSEGVWRINCGATYDYDSSILGVRWMQDEPFYGLYRWGNINGNHSGFFQGQIQNAQDPEMFRTHHWGGTDMQYKIELPNGKYAVKILMAETYWQEPDKRVFDLAIEGMTILRNIDLVSWRGYGVAYERTVYIQVNDQCLDITFPNIYRDNALISGLEVAVVDVSNDAFLDFIQKKMFWYFWNECNPQTGLVKDVEENWQNSTHNVASIATTGLALSVYTIAAERGWITRQEAYQRVMNTLNSFDTLLTNIHGFWYHFVDMNTGQRAGTCEVSTVDSALFIMGALQAGEYFKTTHPQVKQKAEELYRRMDWTWFTNIGDDLQKRFVNMGWIPEPSGGIPSGKPEGGCYTYDWWNRYCESVFVDLLALGSPTHPIGISAWTDMIRDYIDIYGYMYAKQPPLFTHQYHHLYFDFRNRDDGFMDYFENSRLATLANREDCLRDPQGRYEQDSWGVTACYGLDGNYYVYGAPEGFHDGTIAPTAAGTSIMFTPEESIRALKRMYYVYKQRLWGRYGYSDSFRINTDQKCRYVLGLDNAPLIIGIENYRTGLVRDTAMSNTYFQQGMQIAGFDSSSTRPFMFASSCEGLLVLPRYAFDDNPSTRWSSQHTDNQWLCIDYRTPRTINKITIDWETAYGLEYKIQVSLDGTNWTDVYYTNSGDGGRDVITFEPVQARFVRMYGIRRGTQWGFSIWEMKIENTEENLSQGKTATASSYIMTWNPYKIYAPSYVIDGMVTPQYSSDYDHYWASVPEIHPWLCIDLGARCIVTRVNIYWGKDKGTNYKLQVSLDGTNWTDVDKDGNLVPTETRYVRLYGYESQPKIYSVWEIQVFGVALEKQSPSRLIGLPDSEFKLGEVYSFPNPAKNGYNPTIHIEVGIADKIELNIYDISGTQIHSVCLNKDFSPSIINNRYAYEYTWDTSNISSGIYIYQIKAYKEGKKPIIVNKKLAIIK